MVTKTINSKGTFNESDFEKLFKSNFKELCFFAQAYVKDLDSAKEIVQESFISLWEKRESVDEERSVIAYLKSSIVNKSLNFLRNNKKFDKDILGFENLHPYLGQNVSDVIVVNELRSRIDRAINDLPEKSREIFLLNRYENLKYKEIAEKLNISVKTVELHMSMALRHMKEQLVHYIGILIIMIILKIF